MSESSNANLIRTHSHFALYNSIPFSKPDSAEDDIFPPIRPPAAESVSVSQTSDSGQGGEDADTDAEAMTEDGSEAAEESDEASPFYPAYMLCFDAEVIGY
jgi:hypothetical protein